MSTCKIQPGYEIFIFSTLPKLIRNFDKNFIFYEDKFSKNLCWATKTSIDNTEFNNIQNKTLNLISDLYVKKCITKSSFESLITQITSSDQEVVYLGLVYLNQICSKLLNNA